MADDLKGEVILPKTAKTHTKTNNNSRHINVHKVWTGVWNNNRKGDSLHRRKMKEEDDSI
mgnify:CR=1 FL=1